MPTTNLTSKFIARLLGLACLGWLGWVLLPDPTFWLPRAGKKPLLTDRELIDLSPSFTEIDEPTFTAREKSAALFGKKLFYDPRFSDSGQISCNSCHQVHRDFTDGRALAFGTTELSRHTPTLINSFAQNWFFWDGRAASLSAQIKGPIEAKGEHGLDRGQVVQLLWKTYRDDYEKIFGPWPSELSSELMKPSAFSARWRQHPVELPTSLAHYALATLSSTSMQTSIIQKAANEGIAPQKYLARHVVEPDLTFTKAEDFYQNLKPSVRTSLDTVFANFSWALGQFERGLVALDSPFDRFTARLKSEPQDQSPDQLLNKSFVEGFGRQEWEGYRLFVASSCSVCHSGATFSDQQFHNIGLPQSQDRLDLGRALGILAAKQDPSHCSITPNEPKETESCRELTYIRDDNNEMVGAFKTPTLRNVARTAPYMHDGRFADIEAVLNHYSTLKPEPAIGHREESLQKLGLTEAEKTALKTFLWSLSSDVTDQSLEF